MSSEHREETTWSVRPADEPDASMFSSPRELDARDWLARLAVHGHDVTLTRRVDQVTTTTVHEGPRTTRTIVTYRGPEVTMEARQAGRDVSPK